jgi:hypothetical protein
MVCKQRAWIGESFALLKLQAEAGFQSDGRDKSTQNRAGPNGNFILNDH